MKKLLLVFLIVFLMQLVKAQNVGIGTTTPTEKLQVTNGNIGILNTTDAKSWRLSYVQSQDRFSIQEDAVTRLTIANGGSIGIGTIIPNTKAILDIGSTTKGVLFPRMTTSERFAITSPPNGLMVYDIDKNELQQYDGTAWRAVLNNSYWSRPVTNRERITNLTDSVGLGTNSPTTRLDVRGAVRIVDGTEANGKVLTSDANGNASWQNTAYNNNDRIMVRYENSGPDSLIDETTTLYDNGGLNFNFINTRFTVSKSGLYHFEGTMQHKVPLVIPIVTETIEMVPFISINGGSAMAFNSLYESHSTVYSPVLVVPFKIDVYLNAGSYVLFKLKHTVGNLPPTTNRPGFISGYLISQ